MPGGPENILEDDSSGPEDDDSGLEEDSSELEDNNSNFKGKIVTFIFIGVLYGLLINKYPGRFI